MICNTNYLTLRCKCSHSIKSVNCMWDLCKCICARVCVWGGGVDGDSLNVYNAMSFYCLNFKPLLCFLGPFERFKTRKKNQNLLKTFLGDVSVVNTKTITKPYFGIFTSLYEYKFMNGCLFALRHFVMNKFKEMVWDKMKILDSTSCIHTNVLCTDK